MRCFHCQTENPDAAHFCVRCGLKISDSTPGSRPGQRSEAQFQELKRLFGSKYTLLSRLGSGAMGEVFLAFHAQLNYEVAIKVLHESCSRDPALVARFLGEAKAAARLSHPNIIPILDIGEVGQSHFFVMRYIDGPDLGTLLDRRGPLPIPQALDICCQVAHALDYAHHKGIVHRDIKPPNILLDTSGSAVVTDFGIARDREAVPITTRGAIVGTPFYMSPEQARGDKADYRADLYSLGVVLYQMLSGRLPFEATDPGSLVYKHNYEEPTPVEVHRPEVDPQVAAAVRRLMAKNPADRFPDALAVVRHLSRPWDSAENLAPASSQNLPLPAEEEMLTQPSMVVPAFRPAELETESPPEHPPEDYPGGPLSSRERAALAASQAVAEPLFSAAEKTCLVEQEVIPVEPLLPQSAPVPDYASPTESPKPPHSRKWLFPCLLALGLILSGIGWLWFGRSGTDRAVESGMTAAEKPSIQAEAPRDTLAPTPPTTAAPVITVATIPPPTSPRRVTQPAGSQPSSAVTQKTSSPIPQLPPAPSSQDTLEPPSATVEADRLVNTSPPRENTVMPKPAARASLGRIYEATQVDIRPEVVRQPPPHYPAAARLKGIQDIIILRILIDPEGNVVEAQVLRRAQVEPEFEKAALEAVRGWRFKPAAKQGQPVSVWWNVAVPFQLK